MGLNKMEILVAIKKYGLRKAIFHVVILKVIVQRF